MEEPDRDDEQSEKGAVGHDAVVERKGHPVEEEPAARGEEGDASEKTDMPGDCARFGRRVNHRPAEYFG